MFEFEDITAREVFNAFCDIMDGLSVADLQTMTGLPAERCREIHILYHTVLLLGGSGE